MKRLIFLCLSFFIFFFAAFPLYADQLDDVTKQLDDLKKTFSDISSANKVNETQLQGLQKRLDSINKVKINTPAPIIAGILYCYVNKFNIKSIDKSTIKEKLSVSESSLRNYASYFSYAIYDMTKIQTYSE